MSINTNLSSAQDSQYPFRKDIISIDGIIKASYEVVSGNMEKKGNGKEIFHFTIQMQFIVFQLQIQKAK